MPLVSAFTDDTSSLSEVRVGRVARFHIEHGAKGFLVNGESGDCFLLSASERKQLLEWVIRYSQGLPVWVNVTAMTTMSAVDLCQHAARHGARGAVVCTPPVSRLFQDEVRSMQSAVRRHGNLQAVFADPDGDWPGLDAEKGPILDPAQSLADVRLGEWLLFDHPRPDEMAVEDGVVTPLAAFGCDRLELIVKNLSAYLPAMKSLMRHGGLNRASRAAMNSLGVQVGASRGPYLELPEDSRKILDGLLEALKGS